MRAVHQADEVVALFVFQFGCAMSFGAAAAAFQEITPSQMRGQVSAIDKFAGNIFGYGLGPTLTAAFTDHYFWNDLAVGKSILVAILISAPVAFVLLWASRRLYRRALATQDFGLASAA